MKHTFLSVVGELKQSDQQISNNLQSNLFVVRNHKDPSVAIALLAKIFVITFCFVSSGLSCELRKEPLDVLICSEKFASID